MKKRNLQKKHKFYVRFFDICVLILNKGGRNGYEDCHARFAGSCVPSGV